jgi:hypothetical protein
MVFFSTYQEKPHFPLTFLYKYDPNILGVGLWSVTSRDHLRSWQCNHVAACFQSNHGPHQCTMQDRLVTHLKYLSVCGLCAGCYRGCFMLWNYGEKQQVLGFFCLLRWIWVMLQLLIVIWHESRSNIWTSFGVMNMAQTL